MKTIYKMLLVNGSCLLGIILVAVVSPDVSVLAFWHFVFDGAGAGKRSGLFSSLAAPAPGPTRSRTAICVRNKFLGGLWVAFLSLDLLLTWMHRHGHW